MHSLEMLLVVTRHAAPPEYNYEEVVRKYREKRRVRNLRAARSDKRKKRKRQSDSDSIALHITQHQTLSRVVRMSAVWAPRHRLLLLLRWTMRHVFRGEFR